MIWHSTLLEQMAQLDIPDNVYNWLVDFFSRHSHCTENHYRTSNVKEVTASIIQGWLLTPRHSQLIQATSGDDEGNHLIKYADDTYHIIPATCAGLRSSEVDNIET
jgi:hypothetical protein